MGTARFALADGHLHSQRMGERPGMRLSSASDPLPPLSPDRGWRFWIDRGGTFTDVVACSPQGSLQVRKVLSVQPERPGDPAVAAIREHLGLDDNQELPPALVQDVRLGTTVARQSWRKM